MVYSWCHGGDAGGQKQKRFLSRGNKLYLHANSVKQNVNKKVLIENQLFQKLYQ